MDFDIFTDFDLSFWCVKCVYYIKIIADRAELNNGKVATGRTEYRIFCFVYKMLT